MKIIVDRVLCLSVATCVGLGPDVYELDKEAKAVVKGISPQKQGKLWVYEYKGKNIQQVIQGAEACPYLAITVIDDNGKQIFPPKEKGN